MSDASRDSRRPDRRSVQACAADEFDRQVGDADLLHRVRVVCRERSEEPVDQRGRGDGSVVAVVRLLQALAAAMQRGFDGAFRHLQDRGRFFRRQIEHFAHL
jgi:hypothetical protein